jgi:protein gp37
MPTKIEWATESWNPITGCSPVSEGCQNCYARRMANRLRGRFGYPEDEPFKVTFHSDKLEQPLHWKKPRMIFVCSMGDLFHENVNFMSILETLHQVWANHRHVFLILTKRPRRMMDYFEWNASQNGWTPNRLSNLWLGVSVENQQRADERIPILLQIPATKRFASIEPMLGPVDIYKHLDPLYKDKDGPFNTQQAKPKIDWVIVGGESGPGARPMHPDWPRSVRDQCQEAGIPFFFKQWGEWKPHSERLGGGIFLKPDGMKTCQGDYWDGHAAAMDRVGKKTAGRLLDGREWNERP